MTLEEITQAIQERRTFLSEDRVYRYALWRDTGVEGDKVAMFIGLNPSTADENADDPTIRRCIGFARDWGYQHLVMANLFALRSTDPERLRAHPHASGPDNGSWLHSLVEKADVVVAAWGTHPMARTVGEYLAISLSNGGLDLKCLGRTKDGHPKHPLYLKKDTALEPFSYLCRLSS